MFNRGSTVFLKVAIFLIGFPVLALCIFLVPQIRTFVVEQDAMIYYLKYVIIILFYGTAFPFYFALFQAFKLLNYIDQNKAFSQFSVVSLKHIKRCAIVISITYAACTSIFYFVVEKGDAQNIIILGLVVVFASAVIAVFAAVLQMLLQDAIRIKSENDLTV